jgi:ABC-type polysaccharide/polyol phosphate export permease
MYPYLEAMWKCRFFWLSLVRMDLRARYRGSALGIGWSLLNPIAMTTILCVVFRVVFKQNLQTYAPYVFTGMTFWGFFASVLVQGCGCFFAGESYIRQYPAPMAIYPLRTVLGAAFHFAIGLLLAVVLACCMGPAPEGQAARAMALAQADQGAAAQTIPIPAPEAHATRTMQLLALPSLIPTFVLLLLLGWSVAVLFGLLNVRFRDTHHLTEIGLQGLFYMTPIMYYVQDLGPRRIGLVVQCNPLVPFLDLVRQPILYGHLPSLATYGIASAIVLILAGAAMLALKFEERRLIFYL